MEEVEKERNSIETIQKKKENKNHEPVWPVIYTVYAYEFTV